MAQMHKLHMAQKFRVKTNLSTCTHSTRTLLALLFTSWRSKEPLRALLTRVPTPQIANYMLVQHIFPPCHLTMTNYLDFEGRAFSDFIPPSCFSVPFPVPWLNRWSPFFKGMYIACNITGNPHDKVFPIGKGGFTAWETNYFFIMFSLTRPNTEWASAMCIYMKWNKYPGNLDFPCRKAFSLSKFLGRRFLLLVYPFMTD